MYGTDRLCSHIIYREVSMGKIFYVMGKSASGKDTIYHRILEDMPGIRQIVLYTTRPMREGEEDGVAYHFVTKEALQDFADAGRLIEMRTYHTVAGDWYYATVDDGSVDPASHDYLAIGTLESYEKVRDHYGAGAVVPIYITVEDGERLNRALLREKSQRTPNYAEVCRRYLADEKDFSPENLARLGIVDSYENDSLADTVARIENEMVKA